MTREELNIKLKHFITCLKCEVSGRECDDNCPVQYEAGNVGEIIENLEAISKALDQEPGDFAKWVAREIFDDEWEYNKDAFAEIACRKLAKLGIVRANGDEWELVEQEPITERIEYGTDGNPYVLSMTNGKVEPQESEDMGDYPDAIPNQFDNMTGSMNL